MLFILKLVLKVSFNISFLFLSFDFNSKYNNSVKIPKKNSPKRFIFNNPKNKLLYYYKNNNKKLLINNSKIFVIFLFLDN